MRYASCTELKLPAHENLSLTLFQLPCYLVVGATYYGSWLIRKPDVVWARKVSLSECWARLGWRRVRGKELLSPNTPHFIIEQPIPLLAR